MKLRELRKKLREKKLRQKKLREKKAERGNN
jgi:hypothetical protein